MQLLAQLDSRRIQLAIAALRAAPDDLIDVTLKARRSVSFGAAWRLVGLLRTLNIELLHIVELSTALVGIAAARYADLPISIVCERMPSLSALTRLARGRYAAQWQLIARFVQRILAPSELLKRNLIALAKIAPERIGVVYPAYAFESAAQADRAALGLAEGKNVALIVPSAYDAGYLQAIDVLERLRKRNVDARLVIIGEGETFQALHRATAQLSLPIRWFPKRAALPEVLAACDVVLDCTEREQLPEGLIAAMLAGKPIVAPRQAGITEVLEPNVAALIVTPADVSDMALQVSRVLQYTSLAARLARSARKRADERFTPEAHGRAMTEFFETAIYSLR
jgi:glycosyltransferase involved in cell wall biosynthesis